MKIQGFLDQLLKTAQQSAGGLGNAAGVKSGADFGKGALAGGALGLLLGNRKARKMGGKAAVYGGLAAVGVLAYKAYGDWQKQQAGAGAAEEGDQIGVRVVAEGADPVAGGEALGEQQGGRAGDRVVQFAVELRVQQLAAPVAGGISADQKTLCFQIFCPPRNGSLICVQQFRQLRLRAAGVMPHCMDQVNLCCADPLFPHREQDQFFRFARDLCDFSFRNIHRLLRASLQEVVSTSLYVQSIV